MYSGGIFDFEDIADWGSGALPDLKVHNLGGMRWYHHCSGSSPRKEERATRVA